MCSGHRVLLFSRLDVKIGMVSPKYVAVAVKPDVFQVPATAQVKRPAEDVGGLQGG